MPTRSDPRISIAPYSYEQAQQLERQLGIGHLLAQVLVRRGFSDPAEARAWLAGDVKHPSGSFDGLEQGAQRLLEQVRSGARITVHGDYDVDGVCSTALLVGVLRRLGADVDWFLPDRIKDGYGLAPATVSKLAARGTQCLLCVDCGITAVEEIAAARAAGLDAIVCDHHTPRSDGALPAATIVHPAIGGYPCTELCATAVVYKLAGALLQAAGEDPATADDDLDLVALATVCDVVALRDENRRLVRTGLRALAATSRPGLRALMAVAQVDPGQLDARALGFRLGPRLNAAGRVARADAALELLLTADRERAREVAEELSALNADRRMIETRILFAAEAQVAEAGEGAAYVVAGEDWHRGVVGIVAGRIAERHHRPVVVIALDGERGVGSARSIPGYDLLAGLEAASEALSRYGGHRAAAGVELAADRVGQLREALCEHAEQTLTAGQLVAELRVDAVACGDELSLDLAEQLERLEPFGAGNPTPNLLVAAATLSEATAMGEGRHARFTIEAGGVRSRAVCFGQGGRAPGPADVPVDAVVNLERNRWAGAEEPRLMALAAPPCAPPPIALTGEHDDFLAAAFEALDGGVGQPAASEPSSGQRTVRDRRGMGLSGTIADLVASGDSVLVLCADAECRRRGLSGRLGGFTLASYAALQRDLELASVFTHVVALDPPSSRWENAALQAGSPTSFCHLAWGDAELRLTGHVMDREFDLRAPLATLYRGLREAGGADGTALERLLRGFDELGTPERAGRLLAVLRELGLARVDSSRRAVELVAEAPRTALERSATYRACQDRLQEGMRFLSQATAQAA